MKDIINKGQIMSIVTYILFGTALLCYALFSEKGFNSYAFAILFFWSITLIIMTIMRLSDLRHSMAYKVLYIMSICTLTVFSELYLHAIYVVFISFAVLWLIAITFLDRLCFHITILMQALSLLFLVLIPTGLSGLSDYNLISFFFSCGGLLIADWIGHVIINILLRYDEETQEYERSLDDMLEIIKSDIFEKNNNQKQEI